MGKSVVDMYEELVSGNACKTDGIVVTDKNGVIPKNQCTAWVNFDGTDGTIRDSYNVSSVVRNDTGDYTINFTTDMLNSNYSTGGDIRTNAGFMSPMIIIEKTTTYTRVQSKDNGGNLIDVQYGEIQFFGGKQ
jgi:N-methylhydantoinase B/oxoprolinase/acetone carboxylase alpha subunit